MSAQQPLRNNLFPVFLKLEQLRVLLVGGRYVALEKLEAILANAPKTPVRIIAQEILPALETVVNQYPNVTLIRRGFASSDLEEVDLVISAVNNVPLSADIKRQANARGLLVNTADTPDLCDFYLSSVVTKGQLKLAISTNGKSPTMAKRLKEFLNDVIPDNINETLDQLQALRNDLKGDFSQKVKQLNAITASFRPKKSFWKRLLRKS